jgi:predicted lipoprotein with Yx(FWY)xxD motif
MRLLRATVPVLLLGVALAACSSGGAAPTTPPATTAAAASAAPAASDAPAASSGGRYGGGYDSSQAPASEAPASEAPAAVTVQLASTTLGDVLADGAGRTLYVFTADSGGTSTCYSSCADNWPALTADTVPQLGTGLAAADFGTTARTDGTTQVTFHGMPLYYYAGDSAPGQTNGQGLFGKWYVVDGTGALVK